MKYPDDFINKVICGDCLEVMKGFPDNCIDTIITDPPYALGFMGKAWDRFPSDIGPKKPFANQSKENKLGGIPYQNWAKKWAKECLRVAKPGSTLLCFGGTRTYHRLACAIEDAGWILKDCIMWLYGSGFPKAGDISKQLDKNLGGKVKVGKGFKHAGEYNNRNLPDPTPQGKAREEMRHKPDTPEATLWNGWKSHGLKPAYEPILVAMKPNEGSYANNALKWGVAGLNIDGGRIEGEKGNGVWGTSNKNCKPTFIASGGLHNFRSSQHSKGRYPANVILDEESAKLLDEQAPKTGAFAKVKFGHSGKSKGIYHDYAQRGDDGETFYNDGLQGASRFFYCAKSSKAERNRGCEGLEERDAFNLGHKDNPGRKAPKKSLPRANYHPTVKPLALMMYLIKLTLMPNIDQIYLDPFCGSGTTLMGCKKLKRKYIGIDNEQEYVKISKCRIKAIPETLF